MTYEQAREQVEGLTDAACPQYQATEALNAFEAAVRADQREKDAGLLETDTTVMGFQGDQYALAYAALIRKAVQR
jgi:hypothetical protein